MQRSHDDLDTTKVLGPGTQSSELEHAPDLDQGLWDCGLLLPHHSHCPLQENGISKRMRVMPGYLERVTGIGSTLVGTLLS